MFKKQLGLALAGVISMTLMAGASNAQVRLGVAAEPYPPFAEKNASGEWAGWEVDIGNAVCAAMQEDCEWVEIAWDGIIPALMSNRIDVIWASMSITEERKKTIDFTSKYYSVPAVLVGAKGSGITFDAAGLEGKIVGLQVATVFQNFMEAHHPDVEVRTYQSYDEHNQDLVAGRIDAVLADSIPIQEFLDSDSGSCCEVIAEAPGDEAIFGPGIGGGLRKGDTELAERINAAIKTIRENGEYARISAKYFAFDIYGE